ncbi:MerR family transcriptional regulator [Lysobacter sp. N42]|uniref:MerR family transcriptional regulator n=1 Tax=Lysobacter sp. N42 TaxID=2545719 RepID=UPI00104A75FA|nr:MerR family transcriptional regulator [Lysobacter sp. N42]TCZ88073.1 MerR family transcriptional regulator [Lysobacter sp. N42]
MLDPGSNRELPPIPAKRYFTIGEVSELCDVKPHVLRYWETEFPMLNPVKRRGNRRYYQRHEVLMVRQIRGLLYEQGYTIGGARLRLESDGRKQETAPASQVLRQMRCELEEVLQLLRS